jgi:uncharacterized protein (DUF488 family)
MKKLSVVIALIAACIIGGCMEFGRRVEGNGNLQSETRHVSNASKIKVLGGMDVFVAEGSPSVKVEADENLLRYIDTDVDGDWIEIKTRDHVNLHSSNPIRIYVTTPSIEALRVTGSGNITGDQKFSSDKNMSFDITGSGDIKVEVNTPKVETHITGSGNLHIKGETRDLEVHVTGSGNYDGADLKAENAQVNVSGSGDATLFADESLKASILGSGNVKYRGNASVEKHIAGSGTVMKME